MALADREVGAENRYDRALQRWSLGVADLRARIGEVWSDLGLADDLVDQPTAALSGGEAARVGLAALLLSRFDVYLLDEPTNDLDLEGLDRLERWIMGWTAGRPERVCLSVMTGRSSPERSTAWSSSMSSPIGHEVRGGWQAYLDEKVAASVTHGNGSTTTRPSERTGRPGPARA